MEGESTTHLDSSVIIAYMNLGDRDQYQYGHRVVYRLREERERGRSRVVVSSAAAVEVLLWLAVSASGPEAADAVRRLRELFEALDPAIAWANEEVCRLAAEIRERDYRIKPADSMIAAQALLDPDSTRLLTTDREVIESKAIDEINERLTKEGRRRRKLKISEE